jgi:hypothetical protein
MKKVRYSIIRYTKKGSYKFSGFGVIDDNNLYTTYTDRNGNKIKKTYEDCIRFLHPVLHQDNEFKGYYSDYEDIQFENNSGYITDLELEVSYNIYIKILN